MAGFRSFWRRESAVQLGAMRRTILCHCSLFAAACRRPPPHKVCAAACAQGARPAPTLPSPAHAGRGARRGGAGGHLRGPGVGPHGHGRLAGALQSACVRNARASALQRCSALLCQRLLLIILAHSSADTSPLVPAVRLRQAALMRAYAQQIEKERRAEERAAARAAGGGAAADEEGDGEDGESEGEGEDSWDGEVVEEGEQ